VELRCAVPIKQFVAPFRQKMVPTKRAGLANPTRVVSLAAVLGRIFIFIIFAISRLFSALIKSKMLAVIFYNKFTTYFLAENRNCGQRLKFWLKFFVKIKILVRKIRFLGILAVHLRGH